MELMTLTTDEYLFVSSRVPGSTNQIALRAKSSGESTSREGTVDAEQPADPAERSAASAKAENVQDRSMSTFLASDADLLFQPLLVRSDARERRNSTQSTLRNADELEPSIRLA